MRNLPSITQNVLPTQTEQQEIVFHLSGENIKKMDLLSKSDPIVVLSIKESLFNSNPEWREVGKTEFINNTSDPEWITPLSVNYIFETHQELRFDVFDVDNDDINHLSEKKRIGSVSVDLVSIVLTPERKSYELVKEKAFASRGTLHIDHEKVLPNNGMKSLIYAQISGVDFEKQHWYRKNRVFFQIFRKSISDNNDPNNVVNSNNNANNSNNENNSSNANNNWILIYKGPHRRKLDFYPFQLRYEQITLNNDPKTPIKIVFYDERAFKSPKIIGSAITSVEELGNSIGKKIQITKIKKDKQKKKEQDSNQCSQPIEINSGFFVLESFRKANLHPFLEYIECGLRLDFVVAIDFTGSNGDPRLPGSLHYLADRPNQYQAAMLSVGEIISSYVTEEQYHAYGFGFFQKNTHKKNEYVCPLTLDNDHDVVNGLGGLMDEYKIFMQKIKCGFPTLFEPIVKKAHELCQQNFQKKKAYTILLILTDGVIDDLRNTANEIIECSTLPLSIIIIGVGFCDFSQMEVLDADDEPLHNGGKLQGRDIVQFVPYNDIINNKSTSLEKEVLKEIPFQISTWAELNNLTPDYFLS